MKAQFRAWGLGYDWEREVSTCEPSYYKWTQWLFVKLFERGLAYQKEAPVNWCPGCATVLANEQVLADGSCERSGHVVEQRELKQWFFKTSAYAQTLLDDLAMLPDWPERVRTMQANWIGRSEGAKIHFQVTGGDLLLDCYTTRPDTLYGATFMSNVRLP